MEIRFIGTGSGKTSLKRFHSSFIIFSEKFNLLVDTGDGISKALLVQQISPEKIDGVLISHFHPDHFSGLASLIVQMKLMKRAKELKIYIHKNIFQFIKDFLNFQYLFEEKMDFNINYKLFIHDSEFLISDDIKFISRQNSHLEKYIKYDVEKKLSFTCSSFYFSIFNKTFLYTGDIGSPQDLNIFQDKNPDFVITETTHISPENISDLYYRFNPSKIYLTHISDEDELKLIHWRSSLPEKISNKFEIASDGMTIWL